MEQLKEIDSFGPFAAFTLPEGWSQEARGARELSTRMIETLLPEGQSDVNITLFYRGNPIDYESSQSFAQLLANKKPDTDLTAAEICAIEEAMGYSNAGDNQYTNKAEKGSHQYPVFSLNRAQVIELKGRRVLNVTGNFQDQHGNATTIYEGVFVPSQTGSDMIYEIMFQAKDKALFDHFHPTYKQVLTAMQWKS